MNFNNSAYFPIQSVKKLISNKLKYRPTVFGSMVTFLTSLYQYYDKQNSNLYFLLRKANGTPRKLEAKIPLVMITVFMLL